MSKTNKMPLVLGTFLITPRVVFHNLVTLVGTAALVFAIIATVFVWFGANVPFIKLIWQIYLYSILITLVATALPNFIWRIRNPEPESSSNMAAARLIIGASMLLVTLFVSGWFIASIGIMTMPTFWCSVFFLSALSHLHGGWRVVNYLDLSAVDESKEPSRRNEVLKDIEAQQKAWALMGLKSAGSA